MRLLTYRRSRMLFIDVLYPPIDKAEFVGREKVGASWLERAEPSDLVIEIGLRPDHDPTVALQFIQNVTDVFGGRAELLPYVGLTRDRSTQCLIGARIREPQNLVELCDPEVLLLTRLPDDV